MTNEQINIKIASALGLPIVSDGITHSLTPCTLSGKYDKNGRLLKKVPNYCNDLNAMHEAEKMLENPDLYEEWLESLYDGKSYLFHATARQRAEAFLQTIGEWEE